MAHYAFVDENNLVTEVIVGKDEIDLVDNITSWEDYYGALRGQTCLRTSYNTYGGSHSEGGTPFRKNYAGPGFSYDPDRDAFIPPKPYESWLLDEATCLWQAPIEYPAEDGDYMWDEETVSWVEVTEPSEA